MNTFSCPPAPDVMTIEMLPDLESSVAEVARALFEPGTVEGVLNRVVGLAGETIDGCDEAGIFVVVDERVITTAWSDPIVVTLDELQFETDEGPCLDAVSERRTFYAQDLGQDQRWPSFGRAATEAGMRSLIAFPMSTHHLSALNLYARLPDAFGATDRAKGAIFATLAGLALDSAEDRADDEKRTANLHLALRTREVIGQAQGILMEREHITADHAFEVLRRASQHLNVKLREVAETLVQTGETPETGAAPPG